MNANQVFQWRRVHRDARLGAPPASAMKLRPVSVVEDQVEPEAAARERCRAINIELPGDVRISLRGDVDPAMIRIVLKSLRSWSLFRRLTHIWIAAGVTDMRRGFHRLSTQVQTLLERQPLFGHVLVFRGRRRDIVKGLWFDGDGLCLLATRLERGRFVWPQA